MLVEAGLPPEQGSRESFHSLSTRAWTNWVQRTFGKSDLPNEFWEWVEYCIDRMPAPAFPAQPAFQPPWRGVELPPPPAKAGQPEPAGNGAPTAPEAKTAGTTSKAASATAGSDQAGGAKAGQPTAATNQPTGGPPKEATPAKPGEQPQPPKAVSKDGGAPGAKGGGPPKANPAKAGEQPQLPKAVDGGAPEATPARDGVPTPAVPKGVEATPQPMAGQPAKATSQAVEMPKAGEPNPGQEASLTAVTNPPGCDQPQEDWSWEHAASWSGWGGRWWGWSWGQHSWSADEGAKPLDFFNDFAVLERQTDMPYRSFLYIVCFFFKKKWFYCYLFMSVSIYFRYVYTSNCANMLGRSSAE